MMVLPTAAVGRASGERGGSRRSVGSLEKRGEWNVGRETKVGLIVGLGFIVLFGVILSSRAGTQSNADLSAGESLTRHTMVKALGRDVDPFLRGSTMELPKEGTERSGPPVGMRTETVGETSGGREEPMRAPAEIRGAEPQADPDPQQGRLAFGPAWIETPGREYEGPEREEGAAPDEKATAEDEAAAPSQRTYTVVKGDTFASIARKTYGPDGGRQWRRIHEANKKTVKDPNILKIGQTLVVPMIPGLENVARKPSPAADRRSEPVAQSPEGKATETAGRAAAESPLRSLLARVSRNGVPEVTAAELGHMFGRRSDLTEAPASVPQMYTIKPGDTFYGIGSKIYGDAKFGRLLYLKNQHLVPDETKLKVGQRILLLDGAEDDHT